MGGAALSGGSYATAAEKRRQEPALTPEEACDHCGRGEPKSAQGALCERKAPVGAGLKCVSLIMAIAGDSLV